MDTMSDAGNLTIILILGYFADKAFGGIVSDYAKRLWFNRIEPWIAKLFKALTGKHDVAQIDQVDVEPIVDVEATATDTINRLLVRIDMLERDNIRLQIQLGEALSSPIQEKTDQAA
jgi:hypothetical protein